MTKAEETFTAAGQSLKGAEQSQMFGKPCFKISGKAFCCFFENCMVFKLTAKSHEKALGLKGAKLFDPSGGSRPMKECLQMAVTHGAIWPELAKAAMMYVK